MTTLEKLDSLVARLRSMSEERQLLAIEALSDITDEPYRLSDEELAILESALKDAKSGHNLVDAQSIDLLNKSWA